MATEEIEDILLPGRERRVKLERLAVLISVATLCLAVGALGYRLFIQEDHWEPLGEYPVQVVRTNDTYEWVAGDQGETTIIPATSVSGRILVAGTKCADEEVSVIGVVVWQFVEPPGHKFNDEPGVAVRNPGCETFLYRNEVPPDVRDYALGLIEEEITPVVRIGGIETPSRNGEEGVPVAWTTEPFALLP